MIAVLVSDCHQLSLHQRLFLVLAVFTYVGIRAGLVSVCSNMYTIKQYFDVNNEPIWKQEVVRWIR